MLCFWCNLKFQYIFLLIPITKTYEQIIKINSAIYKLLQLELKYEIKVKMWMSIYFNAHKNFKGRKWVAKNFYLCFWKLNLLYNKL